MTQTETTTADSMRHQLPGSWVFYDGECPLCTNAAARFSSLLHRYHFQLAPLQTPWVRHRLDLRPSEPLVEMKLVTADGQVYGGAEALLEIARRIWWAWPVFALAQVPGAMVLAGWVYHRIATNRACISGICTVNKKGRHHGATTFFEMP